jgi:hypothetical protein
MLSRYFVVFGLQAEPTQAVKLPEAGQRLRSRSSLLLDSPSHLLLDSDSSS